MPDFSYSGNSPWGSASWNATYPTFSSIMGSSPGDLLSLLNSFKQSNAAQNYGFESNLLDKTIGGQKDLANLGYASAANLQAGQLGEQGREFDVSAAFGREQEKNKYAHLAALLANQKQNEEFDRNQQYWRDARETVSRIPAFVKPLPRQPNVNAASFSQRLDYNNEIADWLAQSGRLRGINNFATPQQVVQPSSARRY